MDAPQKLSTRARHILESSAHDLFLSAASYWEICIKVSIGKLRLAAGWQATADREMTRNRIEWLAIEKTHLQGLIDLPWIHRDPFDRLLVAQAMVAGMGLLTSDRSLDRYPVETCW